MRVLGVDPGSIKTGWGVIECHGPRLTYLASGTLDLGRKDPASRLAAVYAGLAGVVREHCPTVLSLERNFLARNVQSAFRIGEARGVAMAVAAAAGMSTSEYTPATIKKAVVGYGRADKAQVQQAVLRLFDLERIPGEDEADALASAVCHALRHGFDERVAVALGRGAAISRATARSLLDDK
ncbi:MAG: crossover junction endodeoxyribonuclease RuvC [Candidatus Binatia bacterium]